MDQKPRAHRLADRIQVTVAQMLERRIKDPRLGFVTVTEVRMTNDLHDATVYYTVLGDEADWAASQAALESATGVLRSEVGAQTGVKFTPTLKFVPDAVPATARHIDELISRAKAADDQVHVIAADAKFAGDPTPYRADLTGADVEGGGAAAEAARSLAKSADDTGVGDGSS